MKSKYLLYVAVAVIILWVAFYLSGSAPTVQAPSDSSADSSVPSKPLTGGTTTGVNTPTYTGYAVMLPTYYAQQISSTTLQVHVAAPTANTTVMSPLKVTGEARGNWYFEASFPVKLINAQGVVLASGHVQATSDWMTTDFVPFTANLSFAKQKPGTKDFLVLMKDNPSGLAKNDAAVEMMVTF